MSTGPGICETCRHTSGYSSCTQCGGGLGYPAPPDTPTVGPCLACRAKIASDEPPVDPEAPTEILTLGDELLLLDGDTTTVSQPVEQIAPDVVATLAPLQPTWRGLLIDCSALLNAIAAKDPAAAAGHVRRFRELLTAAARYGS